MVHTKIGANRASAGARLIGLVALAALSPVLLTLMAIAGGLYFVIDILTSGTTNRRSATNNMLMRWLKGIFMWPLKLLGWVAVGRDFPGVFPHPR